MRSAASHAVNRGVWAAAALGALLVPMNLQAAGVANASVIAPASQRFASADVPEIPHLQRHVLPLLGRLGCNGRACHGSFQGQGGFRLSLFGYDFKMDYDALATGDDPRVVAELLQRARLVIGVLLDSAPERPGVGDDDPDLHGATLPVRQD